MKYEVRKAQALGNKSDPSIGIVLPRSMCKDMGLSKGDYVMVSLLKNKIVVEKAK